MWFFIFGTMRNHSRVKAFWRKVIGDSITPFNKNPTNSIKILKQHLRLTSEGRSFWFAEGLGLARRDGGAEAELGRRWKMISRWWLKNIFLFSHRSLGKWFRLIFFKFRWRFNHLDNLEMEVYQRWNSTNQRSKYCCRELWTAHYGVCLSNRFLHL